MSIRVNRRRSWAWTWRQYRSGQVGGRVGIRQRVFDQGRVRRSWLTLPSRRPAFSSSRSYILGFISRSHFVVAEAQGIEPCLTGLESVVLPVTLHLYSFTPLCPMLAVRRRQESFALCTDATTCVSVSIPFALLWNDAQVLTQDFVNTPLVLP